MILKAIEMQGFKSFPEKTVLHFNRGITAVVGPNGSGKSNISDAVRWVLGEQSTKSLRSSKMEDVIFDGTKVRKAHTFAQVTLYLDNSDRTISEVDEDEVTVTRRFFRSGESEYKVNGKNVLLRELHALFMDTGLGRDGYSLVSQGKIADMISGKGRECRDMLEEACGISAYRYRRQDSLKRLAQAEENLLRLRDILTELEERIGPLKIQSEKAEKFLVLSDERKTLEIGLWLYAIEKLKDDLRAQEDAIAVATEHYEQSEQTLQDVAARTEDAINRAQQITVTIDEIRTAIAGLEEEAAQLDAQCAVLQNSVQHNEETIARIERDRQTADASREQLQKEIDAEQNLINQINEIRTKKQTSLDDVKAGLQQMSETGGSLEGEADAVNARLSALAAQAADAKVAAWSAQSAMSEILERKASIGSVHAQQAAALTELNKQAAAAKEAVETAAGKLEEANNVCEALTMKAHNRATKADELKKQLDEIAFDLQRSRSKHKMLEDLEKTMDGYSGAVKAAIQEAERGRLHGIHATVSKLIAMEPDYAVAIETALGNAVQHIVCDTENDAKAAIRYLKQGAFGRATFQPISAVKAKLLDEKGLDECFGFVGMANELVSCDAKYRGVMDALLGRCAVAEDLDCAVVIAKQFGYRFKIVTLDGQVVNPGGSMTGGSQSKTAGFLTRNTEIERLQQVCARLDKQVADLTKQHDEALAAAEETAAALREAKENQQTLAQECIRLEGEQRLFDEQCQSAKDALETLDNELSSFDRRLGELQQDADAAQQKTASLEAEAAALNETLQNLQTQKQSLTEQRETLTAKLSKLTLELHDADKDLAVRTDSMHLLLSRLVSQEDRDKQLVSEIEEINVRNRELQQSIADAKALAAQKRNDAQSEKDRIVTLQQTRLTAQEESATLRQKERELTAEREQIGGEKARLEAKKETMVKEYDETVSRLYDDYQLTLREAQQSHEKTDQPTAARRRLGEIRGKIRALGSVNVGAIDEYKEVNERYTFMRDQLQDVERSKAELQKLITELTDKMSNRFREQFSKINSYFDETFRELFDGGKAELQLVDPADVLESDIDIRLQPPGKNVKRMDALSGGEKGLSAIALLFAILKVNPAPFCIFDEVEAALDDSNVTRYAQYVRRMTKNTQFILITHRRGTMEEADMLYGITMQEQGVSKLLELKTAEIANRLGITG